MARSCRTCRWCQWYTNYDLKPGDPALSHMKGLCHFNPPSENGHPFVSLKSGFCSKYSADFADDDR